MNSWRTSSRAVASALVVLVCALTICKIRAETLSLKDSQAKNSLWALDNLVAWGVVPFDTKQRDPEDRAEMLEKLGFKHFAYSWRDKHIPTFDAEIEALNARHIDLIGWALYGSENPNVRTILETFRRHDVHPHLWVMQPSSSDTPQEWTRLLPKGFRVPVTDQELDQLSPSQKQELRRVSLRIQREDFPKTAEEQRRRVELEADRINSLVKLAAAYGVKVDLYNHNGWFGTMDNEVSIIQRLKTLGVTDVGIVYNFSHARDDLHDDTTDFGRIWKEIEPYTVVVNITGTHKDGTILYPSQGDRELQMMQIIQQSGWNGYIGVIAEKGGDSEETLRNSITGLKWLAAELIQPGSGGPKPFPSLPKSSD